MNSLCERCKHAYVDYGIAFCDLEGGEDIPDEYYEDMPVTICDACVPITDAEIEAEEEYFRSLGAFND